MANPTIQQLAADLAAGRTTSRKLTEEALARIEDAKGEGKRAFIKVWRTQALAAAEASDALRKAGMTASLLAGIPVSIKNLCNVAGETTLAGSKALGDAPPAESDAPVVARLRAAGAVIVGSTNMSEFAFSGVGFNPHYGTPGNPADRTRVPGGSSSGAAVSVADRMAVAALGTDTGGSVRIPAAVCGIVGFKPTARRVPIDGVVPLSTSLDSIGPLANSVECCAIVDAVFAAEPIAAPEPMPLTGLRLAVPKHYVMDDLDPVVAKAFERALKALAGKGVRIEHIDVPQLDELPAINAKGGFAAAEAYAWHKELIARRGRDYDPLVAPRIRRGAEMTAADYIELLIKRADLQKRVAAVTSNYDAIVMPTCAITAPTLDEVSTPEGFTKKNMLLLRNTSVGNFLDHCGISLPCHASGELPVGFMLMGEAMADKRVLAMARSVAPMVKGH
ncbi:MAG: aspartyl-tRNA(Asn)/glutamyl-tRNA(Gln) amidotransferase subunit [Rhodospirillaceae bacterium]|jgi:aspartyl-tRNA(Asn)/glutamyl-tRNA(Gln) amidotransferase subunit A|nr:aspartyl-tRNA(Asn)/glutamyl-tRNA(Gln) amidotransferase subunit [Rhodospirillaceae bacterium]MEA2849509.1 aspartyl-tRNA(Asn)/glutamyl-tRNA(Gln) amidotransferase subunit [Rhodospirillaceae bacterium]